MTLPNVHIIGVQKAATTSLFYWLGQHTDIYAPLSAKDYPIFASDAIWDKGLDNYAGLFRNSNKEKIVLAGSVHTLKFSHARERLKQAFPESKLIVVLRDPVDRLLSAYNYRVKFGVEALGFEEALNQEELRAVSESFEDRAGGAYVTHGFYHQQLVALLKLYNTMDIKLVWFEDLSENPANTVNEIFKFLGVKPDESINFDKKNVTGKTKNKLMSNLIFGENKFRQWLVKTIISKIIPLEQRSKIRHWISEKNTSHSPPPEVKGFDRKSLIPLFINDIQALEGLTKRDLSAWKKE